MQAIALAQRFPTGAAAQHVVEGHPALGDAIEQALAQLGLRRIRVVQEAIKVLQLLLIGFPWRTTAIGRVGRILEKHFFDVQHVRRHFVASRRVGRALTADEHHREGQLRQAEDHLVDPARHASAHVRPGAFEQQADVGQRCLLLLTHVQLLTSSANGGRCRVFSGSCASRPGISS
ncbi:hypothetical protein D3C73_818490 [compost metagenome]